MTSKLINIVALATSTLLALPAAASETVYFDPVSAIASAAYTSGCSFVTVDNALDWWGKVAGADKIIAAAEAGSANAGAALSLPNVAVAVAQANGGGGCVGAGASGILTGSAAIYDPQGRGSVKLRVKFKAAGSSAVPNAERMPTTGWSLRIATALDDQPFATFDQWGDIVSLFEPDLLNQHMIFQIYGATGAAGYQEGGVDASWICDSVGGCAYLNGYTTELARTVVFDGPPGRLLYQLRADASEEGLAVIDPVLEPDPSNPDVVITMEGPTGVGGFAPLAGITADQLIARGIDPGPFIRLGFLDTSTSPPPPPPSDGGGGSTPPPPSAPKYWCSPGFWLNNAVNFGASAWPASERTYYDYNSTAGQLTSCPAATGNPTLLQVLQNPKLYFSTQLKGAGFNCVGDYLSGKSGLTGTMAENNGVCSIDQSGREIQ